MTEAGLLLDLAAAVLVAFVGGVLAQRLGLPVVVGYLLAGVAIGPFTPGFHANPRSIDVLAEIGVTFLMFAVGAEFSRAELRRLGRIGLVGGLAQLVATMAIGPALAPLLGVTLFQGVFLGAIIALSSTVVAVKLLMARGELDSLHGHVALGILIAQDLAVIPMVIVLPHVGGAGGQALVNLLRAGGEAIALVLGVYLVGVRAVPWVLGHVAVARTRELFLLGVVGLALGTALAAQAIGLSLAFGAFLAGLVVAESEYRAQVVAEAIPLRDLFTSLFFVSVGMLIDPRALLDHAGLIALLTAATLIGKPLVITVVVLLLGFPGRVAVLAGLSLAQIGEFSFVLAQVGVSAGAIPRLFVDLALAISLTTVVLAPFTLRTAPALLWAARHLPAVGRYFEDRPEADEQAAGLRRHVVVCGCGRVGGELVEALRRRSIPCVIVEYNPEVVRRLRGRDVPVIYGDAANPAVLEHAATGRARLLAALVPDVADAERIVRSARAASGRLHVVARAQRGEDVERLRTAGADVVVQPEFEAGVEVIRHALQRYGVSGMELSVLIGGRRRSFYEREVTPPQ
ncbi:MAG TPA: cation:proton antiporter [Candidatus Dormibacteraeota bacterium]|nr:cation:proton antiporter [Candidatus Dormibacteraeota bacterium]